MTKAERIKYFKTLMQLNYDVAFTVYDYRMTYVEGDQEQINLYEKILKKSSFKQAVLNNKDGDVPLVFTVSLGLVWCVIYEKENNNLEKIHVIGPVFLQDISATSLEIVLNQYDFKIRTKKALVSKLKELPIIPIITLYQYIIMFNYAVNKQRVEKSDIHHLSKKQEQISRVKYKEGLTVDRRRIWAAEQALLNNVRQGNLDYKKALDKASSLSKGLGIQTKDSLKQGKNSVLVFISLCQRAAIEGGLSPDTAYTVGDMYAQNLLGIDNFSDVVHTSHSMYFEFVNRVHDIRSKTYRSKGIQRAVEYIESHVFDNLDVKTIADYVGYSKYYLTRKFSDEMGSTVNQYIHKMRVNEAKLMLTTTQDSLQEIADRLYFSSRSHFSDVFKQLTGISPSKYRQENMML